MWVKLDMCKKGGAVLTKSKLVATVTYLLMCYNRAEVVCRMLCQIGFEKVLIVAHQSYGVSPAIWDHTVLLGT